MNTYFDIPHRLVGKALYESYYDHFGQMDIWLFAFKGVADF